MQHGNLYLHLYDTFVIINLLNEILKLNLLTMCSRHETVSHAPLHGHTYMYGVSGALDNFEREREQNHTFDHLSL